LPYLAGATAKEMITLIHHPEGEQRLGDFLIRNLTKGEWTHFGAAVAFVKRSGVKHLAAPLKAFVTRSSVKVSVGVDHGVTSVEGLEDLLEAVQPSGSVWVFHNEASTRPTFHPKVFLFWNDKEAECFLGSGNLTEGGLFTNYEAFVHLRLLKSDPEDKEFFKNLSLILDGWSDPTHPSVKQLTLELIKELHQNGYIPTEKEIQQANTAIRNLKQGPASSQFKKLFGAVATKAATRIIIEKKSVISTAVTEQRHSFAGGATLGHGFVMTLQQTDAGIGQTTKGTSKRSPEIFIPLAARDENPAFWGWQKLFRQDPTKPGKWDRQGVRMRLGGQVVAVNMMTWPDKSDFRLRSAAIRDAGSVGDVLRVELSDGKSGYDYYVEIVSSGSSDFARYYAHCTRQVRNSKKKYGYY
jgi:HKD family nuclease